MPKEYRLRVCDLSGGYHEWSISEEMAMEFQTGLQNGGPVAGEDPLEFLEFNWNNIVFVQLVEGEAPAEPPPDGQELADQIAEVMSTSEYTQFLKERTTDNDGDSERYC